MKSLANGLPTEEGANEVANQILEFAEKVYRLQQEEKPVIFSPLMSPSIEENSSNVLSATIP
jgi:hypothetical protein